MAFENLFIRSKREFTSVQNGVEKVVELDAFITESHTDTVRLTKNPVEHGVDISDHAVIEPKKLLITAQVSDSPLGTAAFKQLVDSASNLFGTSTEENLTRSQVAYNDMLELKNARKEVSVQTKLGLINNLIIVGISVTQNKDTSRMVLMSISMEQVIISESEIRPFQPDTLEQGETTEKAQSADDRGQQEAIIPTDEKRKSVAKWIGGFISG